MPSPRQNLPVETPETPPRQAFSDAAAAVARLEELYAQATRFLRAKFDEALANPLPLCRYRAFYPEVRITTASFAQIDSRLSFGHVAEPGTYSTTITRPDLFANYLNQQIGLLIENHDVAVEIGPSDTPIPIHFAMAADSALPQDGALAFTLRDVFDVPDLSRTNDDIVNGHDFRNPDGSGPLAPFTAQRVDYSLARLAHYTATDPKHFQNHVLFTNYQFYVDGFIDFARAAIADPASGYTGFVAPGGVGDHPIPMPRCQHWRGCHKCRPIT
jgi:AMP nucleosidase